MEKSKPLIFLGTEDFSLESLSHLIKAGWQIAAVITKPDSSKGRNRSVEAPAVKALATEHSIPVIQPEKWDDNTIEKIKGYDAQAAVLVAYGMIIPERALSIFPKGIINVHPSLLPKYRGPSPIEAAILHGDRETGTSLISLSHEVDAGPIYVQETLKISDREDRNSLRDKLAEQGAKMLTKHLADILSGTTVPKPQDETRSTTTKLIKKEDGLINWSKPAQLIERQVRAYLGWPGSRTTLAGKDIVITSASIVPSYRANPGTITVHGSRLVVACDQDSLVIEKLRPAGKNEMTAEAFLAGYGSKLDRL